MIHVSRSSLSTDSSMSSMLYALSGFTVFKYFWYPGAIALIKASLSAFLVARPMSLEI